MRKNADNQVLCNISHKSKLNSVINFNKINN